MKKLTLILAIITFHGFLANLSAQDKFEKEFQIETNSVPANAVVFISNCCSHLKMNWYKEESQDGITFEAKSFKRNNRYSIEFDIQGNLIDVEKVVKFHSMASNVRGMIKSDLSSFYSKYKIRKVQSQWTGNESTLRDLINNQYSGEEFKLAYEIVVEGKKGNEFELDEFLFDENGNRISVQKIIERSNFNLEF